MKITAIFLSILIVIAAGCAVLSGSIAEGEIYEGKAAGYRGEITAQVRIHNGNITEIIVESNEDRFVGGAAIEELIETIIENNSTDVDAVSGATISSRGFIDSVNNAMSEYRQAEINNLNSFRR